MTSMQDLLTNFPVERLEEAGLDPLLESGARHLEGRIDPRKDATDPDEVMYWAFGLTMAYFNIRLEQSYTYHRVLYYLFMALFGPY